MAHATDARLRERARALAALLLFPPGRHAGDHSQAGGSARLVTVKAAGLDLDTDATLERLAERPRLAADDLRWRRWHRPARALVLLVDASGSVSGEPLATAVVTAAALAQRLAPGDELAAVAFSSAAVVLRHVASPTAPSTVLDALLDLRAGDTTDLALGLRTALAQAGMARARRRELVVLTDGLANEGEDALAVAARAEAAGARVHVLALSGEPDALHACRALAAAGAGRMAPLARPSEAPAAVMAVLGGP
jgi:Mg-chelatase subunit ChlD